MDKRILVDCGNGLKSKYRKVLDESVNVTSTNIGFLSQHTAATYEQA